MKIIKKGILPENILYEGTCGHCHCEVECNYTEVSKRNRGNRYSGELIEYSVPCPTKGCNRQIILTEKPDTSLIENLMR